MEILKGDYRGPIRGGLSVGTAAGALIGAAARVPESRLENSNDAPAWFNLVETHESPTSGATDRALHRGSLWGDVLGVLAGETIDLRRIPRELSGEALLFPHECLRVDDRLLAPLGDFLFLRRVLEFLDGVE